MISSHVKISYSISFLFCPFNYTKICWCMTETSWDLLRSSSAIFGNLRKIFGNVRKMSRNGRLAFRTILENLRKVIANLQKIVKTASSACLYNKKNITFQLEDMNFTFSWQELCLTRSLCSLMRYSSCHSNIKFTSSRHCVISSIYITVIYVNVY